MTEWRHQIHEKPEIAYQEKVTSKFISDKLKDFGVEVIENFGKTGVIGIIHGKKNKDEEKHSEYNCQDMFSHIYLEYFLPN